jgi:transposase
MSKRDELTDAEWRVLEPWLPSLRSGKPGRSYQPHRPILNGIFWKLRTGPAGRTCPSAMARIRLVMTASDAGSVRASGNSS